MNLPLIHDSDTSDLPSTNSLRQLLAGLIALSQWNVVKEEEIRGIMKFFKRKHEEKNVGSRRDLGGIAVIKEDEVYYKSTGSDHVIGVRVNGSVFHFYFIEISESVCDAMRTLKPATIQAPILEVGKPQGSDFRNQHDRDDTILVMDYLRGIITRKGSRSIRYAFSAKVGLIALCKIICF